VVVVLLCILDFNATCGSLLLGLDLDFRH